MSTNDLLWRMFCLGGCAVAVFGYGFSGWWFLLALMLCSE